MIHSLTGLLLREGQSISTLSALFGALGRASSVSWLPSSSRPMSRSPNLWDWIGIQINSRASQIAGSASPNLKNLFTFTLKSTTDLGRILQLQRFATELNADPDCQSPCPCPAPLPRRKELPLHRWHQPDRQVQAGRAVNVFRRGTLCARR